VRKTILIGLQVVLALFLILVLTGRCYPLMKPPSRACEIKDLVLNGSSFPPGGAAPFPPYQVEGPIQSPLRTGGYESAGRSFYLLNGIANHDVRRYVTKELAARIVRDERHWEFFSKTGTPLWSIPEELDYRSPIADQYYLGCGIDRDIYMCKAVMQYEEYYIFVNTAHMAPWTPMTIQDLERVFRDIDERMAKCLGKPLPE
jgi:hypothetical protein